MAADFFAVVTDEAISEIMSAVDPDIRDILCQVGRVKQDVIVKELIASSDVKRLLNVRCTIFRAAMDRVDFCLSQVAKALYDNECDLSSEQEKMIEKAESLLRSLVPKDMIQRKCIKRLSNDILDLLYFAGGSDVCFPTNVLKASAANGSSINPHEAATARAISCLQHVANSIRDAHGEESDDWKSDSDMEDTNAEISMVDNGTIDLRALMEKNPYEVLRYDGCMSTSEDSESSEALEEEENGADDLNEEVSKQSDEMNGDISEGEDAGDLHDEENETNSRGNDGYDGEESSMECMQVQVMSGNGTMNNLQGEDGHDVNIYGRESVGESCNVIPKMAGGGAGGVDTDKSGEVQIDNERGIAPGYPGELIGDSIESLIGHETNAAGDSTGVAGSNNHASGDQSNCSESAEQAGSEDVQCRAKPNSDSLPSKADKSVTVWAPIKVTVKVGDFVAEVEVPMGSEMASRSNRVVGSGRSGDGGIGCGCKECGDRFEAQDRRIGLLEEMLAENTRENAELKGDVRELRGMLADSQNCEQNPCPLQGEVEYPPQRTLAEPVESGRGSSGSRGIQTELQEKRGRAASYGGTTREGRKRGGRVKPSQIGKARAESKSPEPRPKPQREKGKRSVVGLARANAGDDNKNNDNTLRGWLVSAAKGGEGIVSTPKNTEQPSEVECSPSWADEPCPDENECDTSDQMTLSPYTQTPIIPVYPETVGECVGEMSDGDDKGEYEVVNIYDLPPSGRVSGTQLGARRKQNSMTGRYGTSDEPRRGSERGSGGHDGRPSSTGGNGANGEAERDGGFATGYGGGNGNGGATKQTGSRYGIGGGGTRSGTTRRGGNGNGNGGQAINGGADDGRNGGAAAIGGSDGGGSGNGIMGATGGTTRRGSSRIGNGGGGTTNGTTRTADRRAGNGGFGINGGSAGYVSSRIGNGGDNTIGTNGGSGENGGSKGGANGRYEDGGQDAIGGNRRGAESRYGNGGQDVNGTESRNGNNRYGFGSRTRNGGTTQEGSGSGNGGRATGEDVERTQVSRNGYGGSSRNGGAAQNGSGAGNGGRAAGEDAGRTQVSRNGYGGGGRNGGAAMDNGRNGDGGSGRNGGAAMDNGRNGDGGSGRNGGAAMDNGRNGDGGRNANGQRERREDGRRENGGGNTHGDARLETNGNGGAVWENGAERDGEEQRRDGGTNRNGMVRRREPSRNGTSGRGVGADRGGGNRAEAGAPNRSESRNGGGTGDYYGGARPKTKGKTGNGQSRGNNSKSYASVVTSNEWKTKQSKKRKYENVSPKVVGPLKGIAATKNRDVYLQGLRLGDCSYEDIVDSVREYVRERDINPVFIRIIPVKFDSTRVGCRLTIREEDFNIVMQGTFWPDNVSVREWTQRPRDNREGDDETAEYSSEGES